MNGVLINLDGHHVTISAQSAAWLGTAVRSRYGRRGDDLVHRIETCDGTLALDTDDVDVVYHTLDRTFLVGSSPDDLLGLYLAAARTRRKP